MTKTIECDYGSRMHIYTREEDARIGENRLSIQVVGESGLRGQMPLSQDQALQIAVALLETIREQDNIS